MHKIVEDLEYESSAKQPSLKKYAGKGTFTNHPFSDLTSDATFGFR